MIKISGFLIRQRVTARTVLFLAVTFVTVAGFNDSRIQESFESVDMFSQKYGSRPVDLVFVLDRSASIPPAGWQSIMAFVYSVLEHFTIDAQNTRVAVITYSTRASVDINDLVNERENKCSLMQRMRQSVENKVTAGYTATHSALKTVYNLLLDSRRRAKKAVIVLTDGRSNIGPPPVSASVDIRSLKWSPDWDVETNGPQVEIFAFGVHDAHLSELQSLSGQLANHTYFLPEFSEYRDLAQLLHKGKPTQIFFLPSIHASSVLAYGLLEIQSLKPNCPLVSFAMVAFGHHNVFMNLEKEKKNIYSSYVSMVTYRCVVSSPNM